MSTMAASGSSKACSTEMSSSNPCLKSTRLLPPLLLYIEVVLTRSGPSKLISTMRFDTYSSSKKKGEATSLGSGWQEETEESAEMTKLTVKELWSILAVLLPLESQLEKIQ